VGGGGDKKGNSVIIIKGSSLTVNSPRVRVPLAVSLTPGICPNLLHQHIWQQMWVSPLQKGIANE